MPGQAQAGHERNQDDQQTHLQHSSRSFHQNDHLEVPVRSAGTAGAEQGQGGRGCNYRHNPDPPENKSQERIGPEQMPKDLNNDAQTQKDCRARLPTRKPGHSDRWCWAKSRRRTSRAGHQHRVAEKKGEYSDQATPDHHRAIAACSARGTNHKIDDASERISWAAMAGYSQTTRPTRIFKVFGAYAAASTVPGNCPVSIFGLGAPPSAIRGGDTAPNSNRVTRIK